MGATCIFCELVAGRGEVSMVHQDERVSAFMDIQPVNPGHVLVVPNQHAADLSELGRDDGARMFATAQRLAAALRQSEIRADGVNFWLADGEVAGQEVFHVHLHVFPRFRGDGFGLQFAPAYFDLPARPTLDAAASAIRGCLVPA